MRERSAELDIPAPPIEVILTADIGLSYQLVGGPAPDFLVIARCDQTSLRIARIRNSQDNSRPFDSRKLTISRLGTSATVCANE